MRKKTMFKILSAGLVIVLVAGLLFVSYMYRPIKTTNTLGDTAQDRAIMVTFLDYKKNFVTDAKTIPEGYRVDKVLFEYKNYTTEHDTIPRIRCFADGVECEEYTGIESTFSQLGPAIGPRITYLDVDFYFVIPEDASEVTFDYIDDEAKTHHTFFVNN